MRYMIIKNKKIINIVDYISDVYAQDNTLEKVPYNQECYIGDEYDSGTDTVTRNIVELSYAEKRVREYPPIQEQLDMIFKDKRDGTDIWFTTIDTIKKKYPKPQ